MHLIRPISRLSPMIIVSEGKGESASRRPGLIARIIIFSLPFGRGKGVGFRARHPLKFQISNLPSPLANSLTQKMILPHLSAARFDLSNAARAPSLLS